MTAAKQEKIDSSILLSANASMLDQLDLKQDIAVSRWSIDRTSVAYEKPDSHTLSLYLKGGETSFRQDQPGECGRPGVLCLMPQGHASKWHIGEQIDFAHLYFTDKAFKSYVAQHYDRDVRFIDLRDLTYSNDPTLRLLLLQFLACCDQVREHAGLLGEQTLYAIFDHLFHHHNNFQLTRNPIKGGLSQRQLKLVKEAISSTLDGKLSIAELASVAGLSPFHFARQFKESTGLSPASYIAHQRLEQVKQLLHGNLPLAQIASITGFAQQSHMTAHFKKQTGYTPKNYRQMVSE